MSADVSVCTQKHTCTLTHTHTSVLGSHWPFGQRGSDAECEIASLLFSLSHTQTHSKSPYITIKRVALTVQTERQAGLKRKRQVDGGWWWRREEGGVLSDGRGADWL